MALNSYTNFTNVRIEGNKFFSEETDGEFVALKQENSFHAGLLLYNPWTFEVCEGGEFGSGYSENKVFKQGKYPQASTRILSEQELIKMTTSELRLMRNEIFARYGYKFYPSGKMAQYFEKQDWYQGDYDNIDAFLSIFELKNIETIQKVEDSKK